MAQITNFTSVGTFAGKPDIQVDYLWSVFINRPRAVSDWPAGNDGMIVRARTAVIPGRSHTAIESFFLGTKQSYPGRSEYPGTFSVQFEEFQDQVVLSALNAWNQAIFDIKTGKRVSNLKKDYTTDIILTCFGTDGVELPKKIKFKNAWIQSTGDVSLSYEGNGAVKYDVTFQYDYWELV